MRRHLLPVMRAHEIDLWIILSRENAPDPALELFGGYGITGWYGHRNAYLFHDAGEDGLQTTVLGTHLSGHLARFYETRELYGEEGLGSGRATGIESSHPSRCSSSTSPRAPRPRTRSSGRRPRRRSPSCGGRCRTR